MSMPALAFSSSPEMRVEELPEPKLILPGRRFGERHEFLRGAASSFGFTIMKTGALPMIVTESKSRSGS
jgi:hypothetical protein